MCEWGERRDYQLFLLTHVVYRNTIGVSLSKPYGDCKSVPYLPYKEYQTPTALKKVTWQKHELMLQSPEVDTSSWSCSQQERELEVTHCMCGLSTWRRNLPQLESTSSWPLLSPATQQTATCAQETVCWWDNLLLYTCTHSLVCVICSLYCNETESRTW